MIDFCLTKTLVTDETTNFTSLELEWASKNSLMQRAGRVGRVDEGRVYRLIHKEFYKVRILSVKNSFHLKINQFRLEIILLVVST